MSSDGKYWVSLFSLVAVFLVTIIITFCVYDYCSDQLFVENGYERHLLVGSNYSYWQKVK